MRDFSDLSLSVTPVLVSCFSSLGHLLCWSFDSCRVFTHTGWWAGRDMSSIREGMVKRSEVKLSLVVHKPVWQASSRLVSYSTTGAFNLMHSRSNTLQHTFTAWKSMRCLCVWCHACFGIVRVCFGVCRRGSVCVVLACLWSGPSEEAGSHVPERRNDRNLSRWVETWITGHKWKCHWACRKDHAGLWLMGPKVEMIQIQRSPQQCILCQNMRNIASLVFGTSWA